MNDADLVAIRQAERKGYTWDAWLDMKSGKVICRISCNDHTAGEPTKHDDMIGAELWAWAELAKLGTV